MSRPYLLWLHDDTNLNHRSFSEMWCVGRSVKYLESRKVDVRGIVTKTFKLEEFGDALDAVRNKTVIKAAIVFED